MKEILIATRNKGKVSEFAALLSKKGIAIKSLLDFPNVADVPETGSTFKENAMIKAEAISSHFQKIVIADDSGLIVDVLNGRPGVFSARYAGEEKSDEKNNQKVLRELEGVPKEKRTAAFHCALAVAIPNKETSVFEGDCAGFILEQPIGENGFGYDPLFYVQEKGKTMAQLSKEEKNKISHRAKALKKLVDHIDEL